MTTMTTSEAVAAVAELLNAAMNALGAATQAAAMIQKATSEGRTTFNDDEWAALDAQAAAARQALVAANAKP